VTTGACLALLLLAARLAAAQGRDPHTVQPERPTVATHAGTVATGWLEIEAGVERDRVGVAGATMSTPVVLKLGLADRAQLSIGASTLRAAGATSLGDLAAGIKWRLVDDAPIVGDFALLPAVKLPTGSGGAGTGTTDVSLLAISSHAFGPIAMDLNAGYTRRSGDGSRVPASATVWTASFGGPIAGMFGWTAECYGYPGTSGPSGQPPIVAVLAGPTILVRRWLAFDAGVIEPVRGPQPRALYAGTVYNVGRIWHARR
jgi:hypothetical protein